VNSISKNLLGQRHIHDFEISRRKSLLGFAERDAALLVACRPFVQTQLSDLVVAFLGNPIVASETALLIRDEGMRKRLRPAVTDYVSALFSGAYDESYANDRLRIGLAYRRLGMSPTHYLCAMHRLKSLLMEALEMHLGGHPDREATRQALDKLLHFDMTLVLDTYIGGLLAEVESSRDKVFEHAYKLEDMVAERSRELKELSSRDPLTGLFHQRVFAEALSRELRRSVRSGKPLTLVRVEVNGSGRIDDALDHLAGGEALRIVGALLARRCRTGDMACRYGSNEFCMLLPATGEAEGLSLARRLQNELAAQAGWLRLGIGVAQSSAEDRQFPERLINAAGHAMRHAKSLGGDQVASAAVSDPGRYRTGCGERS
jgi:diguanylate cyclase (GGDEF)-like protein